MGLSRKVLIMLRGGRTFCYPKKEAPSMKAMDTQQKIYEMLLSPDPCMIARFGSVELQSVVDYLNPPTLSNAFQFIKGEVPSWGYAPSTMRTMHINAGFFPATKTMLDRFGKLMLECMPMVDMLGSWRSEEAMVMQYMPQTIRVPLYALEPYYLDNPWTPALEGKKVLVVHPFEDTIRKQHEKSRYRHLFADPRLTPDYELQTLKAVQSVAGNKPAEFDDWFQALDWMKGEIDKRDFDIAIIGCGAYGFPLAAHVKQIGKKAVHMGGAVANLFGIRSNAVEKRNKWLAGQINEYWVRPSDSETPKGIEMVEGSRYW
jgi:hypothetical protein